MRQVLIVGGGGGLGSALVQKLLASNHRVLVAGRTKPVDRRVEKFYPIDATNQDWCSLYDRIEQEIGAPIDAIVFVSGSGAFGKTRLIPLEQAHRTFELNFWACSKAALAAAEYWTARQRTGRFLAVLSISALRAVPFEAYYCASKGAAAQFLECLQLEYAHEKVEFLCAFPGLLKTSFRRNAECYGFEPSLTDEGTDVNKTACAILKLLEGRRKARVIGWRERSINLSDRLFPRLYDAVILRKRVQRQLKTK